MTAIFTSIKTLLKPLLNSTGSELVGFIQKIAGAIYRTLQSKLSDTVSVFDFMTPAQIEDVRSRAGALDVTAPVQAAINSLRSPIFPDGLYSCTALTQTAADQQFIGMGNVTISRRSGSAPVLSSSGRAVVFRHIKFLGTAGTGETVVCTGDNPVFDHCSASTSSGYAVWSKGNGTRIIGTDDIYYSPDVAGAAIAVGVTGTQTYYAQITGINTSTSAKGIKYFDHGASGITNCQLNTVDMSEGAAYISNCRIVGDYVVGKSFNIIDNSTISGNVTLGNGSAISGIGFGDKVFMQSGSTLTVNANIRESTISFAQIGNGGVNVIDNLTGTAGDVDNVIFTGPRTFIPTWAAATTSPTLGNGTLTGTFVRNGRTVTDTFALSIGSTTTTGTGEYTFTLSHNPGIKKHIGAAVILDAGSVIYTGCIKTKGDGTKKAAGFTNNAGTGLQQNSPMVWANGDTLEATITYMV